MSAEFGPLNLGPYQVIALLVFLRAPTRIKTTARGKESCAVQHQWFRTATRFPDIALTCKDRNIDYTRHLANSKRHFLLKLHEVSKYGDRLDEDGARHREIFHRNITGRWKTNKEGDIGRSSRSAKHNYFYVQKMSKRQGELHAKSVHISKKRVWPIPPWHQKLGPELAVQSGSLPENTEGQMSGVTRS